MLIRPVLEYACQVWHSNLQYLSNEIVCSKRSLKASYPESNYVTVLRVAGLTTLEDRKIRTLWILFQQNVKS